MADIEPGCLVHISVLEGNPLVPDEQRLSTYSGLVSTTQPSGDGWMRVTFWSEPAFDETA